MINNYLPIGIASAVGQQNDITVTRNPQNTVLSGGSILTLPNAKPSTAQISITVDASMMPTIASVSGDLPSLIEYFAGIVVGGVNNNASSARTVNCEITHIRGGNSHTFNTTSASIAVATKTFAINDTQLQGNYAPAVGDTIEIRLWCSESASDMQVSKYCMVIQAARVFPVNDTIRILKDVYYKLNNVGLTTWTSNYSSQQYLKKQLKDYELTLSTSAMTFDLDRETSNGVLKHQVYENAYSLVLQHASQYQFQSLWYLEELKWKKTNLKMEA